MGEKLDAVVRADAAAQDADTLVAQVSRTKLGGRKRERDMDLQVEVSQSH